MDYKAENFTYRLIFVPEIDSTNNFFKERGEEELFPGVDIAVVYTDHQTAGRGQRGNSWQAQPGKNLIFSIRVRPRRLPAKHQFLLSEAVALAVKDVLTPMLHWVSVKWPNDIYWKNRKLVGILIENDLHGELVTGSILGVGINVNQVVFDPTVPNPVSMQLITGREYDRVQLLHQIVQRFAHYYAMVEGDDMAGMRPLYEHSLYRRHGLFPYSDAHGHFMACIEGVDESGELLLRDESGDLRHYAFKEVQYDLPAADAIDNAEPGIDEE